MRALVMASLSLVLAACGGAEPDTAADIPTQGVARLSDQFTGDFALIDKDGKAVTDEDFEGKVMLVYIGFTNCPDVCPGDVGVMSATLNELGDKADQVAPIFISADPERDTPEVLRDYFGFDDRIIALTGSLEATSKALASFKAYAQKEELADSALGYTVNHTRFYYLTDRNGQPEYGIVGGVGPTELAALVRRSISQ
ncbi:SCO family protein [Hyphococcus sp. DH-69]|uniref:SCO family protein n=1 Tax=Hyphococcus formosus TaxID=3143534 RepID=UPI00398AC88F